MEFRQKRSVKQGYVRQGYIYFVSRRYHDMDRVHREKILELCRECGGEYHGALFDFVTSDASATEICLKHAVGKSTLYRIVRKYYETFPKWI